MAIWVLVLFSILCVAAYNTASSQLRISQRLKQQLASLYLAKSAYAYASTQRKNDTPTYDTLYALRHLEQKELGMGSYEYIMVDEESRININRTSQDIMEDIPGITETIAKNILKSDLYPFNLKEELLLIDGMDSESFKEAKDYITVYGAGAVNINTASAEVMGILGMEEGLIGSIQFYRQGPDAEEGTEDDRVFESKDTIIERLSSFGSLSAQQHNLLEQLINDGFLGVFAEYINLEIQTKFLNKPVMKYKILMDKEGIKRWEEK